jgi:UbiD family decarboxylase
VAKKYSASPSDLRSFIQILEKEGELRHIYQEVDADQEIAEIHRRTVAEGGKALYFHKVKNSPFPVVTNLFGSLKRLELAFPEDPEVFVQTLCDLATKEFPPTLSVLWKKRAALSRLFSLGTTKNAKPRVKEVLQNPPNLTTIPLLKLWPDDGGHFITLPLVYTEHPATGTSNLGMYRIQRFDETTTGLHFQIGKGGGFHYHFAETNNQPLPVAIFIGGPPALIISAIAPLPENVPELLFASMLQNKKIETTSVEGFAYPLIANCEFALLGTAFPHERREEGPFGDHYGYYSLAHDFPVFHCQKIYHKKDAIYPATVVGKPVQEDLYIGKFLQKLLSPLFPIVMPQVKKLHTFGETGFHPLACAVVHERYEKECLAAAFRILGEGQLSLTKVLMICDQDIDITSSKLLFETILERFSPENSLLVLAKTSNDTLDYTGPKLNLGSKAIIMGVGEKKRSLPRVFQRELPRHCNTCIPYCGGCLCLDGPSYTEMPSISWIAKHPSFSEWPLVILVDDAKKACSSDLEFLWTVFTRFEPARDLIAKETHVHNHHLSYTLPLVIDARHKPFYPKEVQPSDEIEKQVSKNWPYF